MRAYGRVEIYRPESLVENFEIKSKITAIGRQTGNDIIVDRNGISRYHAKLTFDNNQMVLEDLDSVNGTYVDGVRIPGSEPRLLRGGEEIQIGDVRFVYYPPDEESQQDTAKFSAHDTTQHVETESVMLHLAGPDMTVVPGANVQAALIVENLGGEPDRFRIAVEGVPRDWVRLERNEVDLNPGEQTHILASFKPARRSDTDPGSHPITFVVTPKNHPEAAAQAETALRIGTYSGYGVTMGTAAI